jgi:putative heme-binding domain-containing protein
MISQLIATAAGEGKPESLGRIIAILAPREEKKPELWQLAALSSLLDAFDRKGLTLASLTLSGAGIFPADDKKGTAGGRPAATIAGGTPAPLLLAPLFAWAIELAAALDTKDSIREPAIRLLGRSPEQQEEDLQMLFALLDPSRSARTHSAALDTLKRIRRPEVASLLLQDWNLRSPSLRQSCIEVLLSRNEWMKQLLAAVESGVIGVSEISPADRQRLLRHTDKGIQGLATTIFKPGHGSRAQVLAKYQSATTLPGDTAKGADLFAKNCSSCHVLRGQGHAVGPTLWQLADKTPADFLLAILDPNAAVEPRFVAYNIETKDGRSLSGIVSAETATTLTVVQGGGAQDKILRSDIAEIRASGLSLMPEGLEQSVTPQDLANLIAYLKSSPRTFGSATSEQAAAAKKKFLDGGMNGFAKIISAFDQLSYPSWMGELPMPYCRQTDGKSKLAWQTALVPADLKPETIHQFRLPAAMGFVSQPSGKFELRLNGRRALDFNVALNDQTWQSADGKVQMSYTVLENNNEDSDGVLLINVSGSLLEPGQPGTFEVVGSAANSQRWFGVYLVPTPSEHATR